MTKVPARLLRALARLQESFAAATPAAATAERCKPAPLLVADVLARLLAMLEAGPEATLAKRLAMAFDPNAADVARLAEIAAQHIPVEEAEELARNLVGALADGVEPVEPAVREMVEHRRQAFGRALDDVDAEQLVAALVRVWETRRVGYSPADLDAMGTALRAVGRAAADAAVVLDRMRIVAGSEVRS